MTDELKKRIKILSRFLGIPKSDIQPSEEDEATCETAPYFVDYDGEEEQYCVLTKDELDDLLVEDIDYTIQTDFDFVQPYLEEETDYDAYFSDCAYDYALSYIEELSEDEYINLCDELGVSIQGDAPYTTAQIFKLRRDLAVAYAETLAFEHGDSYRNWYISEYGWEGVFNAFVGGLLYGYSTKSLFREIYKKYGYEWLSCDGTYHQVGDYYIIRVK